jgi:hypothetical protein
MSLKKWVFQLESSTRRLMSQILEYVLLDTSRIKYPHIDFSSNQDHLKKTYNRH